MANRPTSYKPSSRKLPSPSKETLALRKEFRQDTKAKMADTLPDLTRMEKETLLEVLLEYFGLYKNPA